jgi:hypothetical protein
MSVRERMKQKLKFLAGLPSEPTDRQLDAIINYILDIQKSRRPTESDWKDAAGRYVPEAGTRKYAGADQSDLNAMLMQLQSARPSAGAQGSSGGSGKGGSTSAGK